MASKSFYPLILCVILVCGIAPAQNRISDRELWQIPKTTVVPLIDGIQDKVWLTVDWTFQNSYDNNGPMPDDWSDLFGATKIMYDDDNMYFLIYTQDEDVTGNDDASVNWQRNGVEIFIDGDNSKLHSVVFPDHHLVFRHQHIGNEANSDWDIERDLDTSGIKWKFRDDHNMTGYWFELKVPLSAISVSPVQGTKIGLEIGQNDNDGAGRESVSKWFLAKGDSSWMYASCWGTAILSDRVVNNDVEIKMLPADASITVDGSMDPVYKSAYSISSNYFGSLGTYPDNFADMFMRAYLLYDNDYLYSFFEVLDDDPAGNDASVVSWQRNAVQIYLDGDNSKLPSVLPPDHELVFHHLNIGNETNSDWDVEPGLDTSGMQWKIKNITELPKGYNVEFKIPLSALNLAPTVGGKIGLEIQSDDNDGNGLDAMTKWFQASGHTSWRDASTWGTAWFGSTVSDLLVFSPKGDESWQVGSTHKITWSSSQIDNVKIEYSLNAQSPRFTITPGTPANTGNYLWTIPNTPTNSARVYVSDVNNPGKIDSSNNVFNIYSPNSIVASIDTVGGVAGDSVLIPVKVRNFSQVGAITLAIEFDSDVLQWGQIKNMDSQFKNALINVIGDTLLISWVDIQGLNITNGKLADLQFLNKGTSSVRSIKFLKNICEIADKYTNLLDVIYINGAIAPGKSLSGRVTYYNTGATPLNNIKVKLSGTSVDSTYTDATGNYAFYGLSNGSYQINLSTTKQWGGVNTTDALWVQRHVIGLSLLEGLRLSAADVNASNNVSSTDALSVQLRYLGNINSFTKGDWVFENPTTIINNTSVVKDIKGMAVGDINGSYIPGLTKINPSVAVTYNGNLEVLTKNEFILPVISESDIELCAITIVINYPENLVEVKAVNSAFKDLIYVYKDGALTISWFDVNPVTIRKGEQILSITYMPAKEFKSGIKIPFVLDATSEFADKLGNVISGVKVNMPSIVASIPKEYMLSQNYPNPFNPNTVIEYDLPEQSKVIVAVYNLLGERLAVLENSVQEAGSYKLFWNASNLSNGVYFYEMRAGNFREVKKLVLLK